MKTPSLSTYDYVPFLKAKAGEFGALRSLPPHVRDRITPFFDVPPLYEDDDVEDRLRKLLDGLKDLAIPDEPFFLDFPKVGTSEEDVDFAVRFLELSTSYRDALPVVPVIHREGPGRYLDSAIEYARKNGSGICLRLFSREFGVLEHNDIIVSAVDTLGFELGEVDLVFDFRDVTEENVDVYARIAVGAYQGLKQPNDWRNLILTSSAFPEMLTGGTDSEMRYPRLDWQLWSTVASNLEQRQPTFGDYGTESWKMGEKVPYGPAPHIRYALENEWVVVKGNKERGHEGFYSVAQIMTEMDEFAGQDFSPGDKYLASRAQMNGGPGGAKEWRMAGGSHHMAHVVNQLASRRAA